MAIEFGRKNLLWVNVQELTEKKSGVIAKSPHVVTADRNAKAASTGEEPKKKRRQN